MGFILGDEQSALHFGNACVVDDVVIPIGMGGHFTCTTDIPLAIILGLARPGVTMIAGSPGKRRQVTVARCIDGNVRIDGFQGTPPANEPAGHLVPPAPGPATNGTDRMSIVSGKGGTE